MLSLVTCAMVGCLFTDLVFKKGAAVVAYFKGKATQVEATVVADVKKL